MKAKVKQAKTPSKKPSSPKPAPAFDPGENARPGQPYGKK